MEDDRADRRTERAIGRRQAGACRVTCGTTSSAEITSIGGIFAREREASDRRLLSRLLSSSVSEKIGFDTSRMLLNATEVASTPSW